MKRTLLFITCVLASAAMLAEVKSSDYIPFVEKGKSWCVFYSITKSSHGFDQYKLTNNEVVKNGKTYTSMSWNSNNEVEIYDAALLREENRKVYIFDTDKQEDCLIFDYSLKAGDTFEAFSYDVRKMMSYKVLSVDDYTEGPDVIRYDEQTGTMAVQHRKLRKWTVCRTNDNSFQKIWIEGVGSLEGPLANILEDRPYPQYLAYVECGYSYCLPFSFHDVMGQVHGCNLPTGVENTEMEEREHHHLIYELDGDRLHVYGDVFIQCGPNNYAYFYEKPTDDPSVHRIEFRMQELEPMMDCMNLHATDFYVTGFDPNLNYIVVDNYGEEHPIIKKTSQMAYRPFVEDGKVWKVGAEGSGNPVQWVEYYYFDGDIIIDGKTCKKMMNQRYINLDYAESNFISQDNSLSYVGAWYEENKKVCFYDTTNKQFKLMYDFSLDANAFLPPQITDHLYVIGPRQTGGISGFKGVYRDVSECADGERNYRCAPWLEGVGGIYGPPTLNVFNVELGDPMWFLMSCTVGDEVIYLNGEYEDGATWEEARKQRIDFTHTIKIKPKTRIMREMEPSLYGEYNALQLGINLNPLDDAYMVRITDESGRAVYEKTVNAANIVGLNIDISAYTEDRYTVIVENSSESFTGEIDTRTTGIKENEMIEESKNGNVYNLQGQRISTLRKGLNIVCSAEGRLQGKSGRKVFVK